eukprot:11817105-Karenia_brevis.AAC.1
MQGAIEPALTTGTNPLLATVCSCALAAPHGLTTLQKTEISRRPKMSLGAGKGDGLGLGVRKLGHSA